MNDQLTSAIIGVAMAVHSQLGPGFLERIYENAMCLEFDNLGISFTQQACKPVFYKGQNVGEQRLDLLVENSVIVELKTLSSLPDIATAQLHSYLKGTGIKTGLLLNFAEKHLRDGIKRISL